MQKPTLKVSGYRGIWGESLTTDIAKDYTYAFGQFIKNDYLHRSDLCKDKPTILIGRDGRESGKEIADAIIPILESLDIDVIDGDILPTPTIMFAVKNHSYDGAIIITASHNPIVYNGLKFVTGDARMINEDEVEKIKNFLTSHEDSERKYAIKAEQKINNSDRVGAPAERVKRQNSESFAEPLINFTREHADFILEKINIDIIRAQKFKVAVDMINASACVIDPYMFEKLGVELIAINDTPNGKFAHTPEPLKENLSDLEKTVKENNCDIGFAQDPDADRLVIVNENGECISEEYTLSFCVENILSKNKNRSVVINMSTSQMTADIAEKYNGKTLRTKVGESNVFAEMKNTDAIIGGEGGGGAIYPTMNNCRDSFVSIALTLELLAERNQKVTELVNSLPKYFIKKDKENIEGKNLDEMYKKLKNHFSDAYINELDGLRLDFPNKSWIHLRPSNTEPIIRLFGEAKTEERIEVLFNEAKKILE